MRFIQGGGCFLRRAGEHHGFSLTELAVVLLGTMILMAAGAPVIGSVWNQYRLAMAAQSITGQLQFARMKAVTSNESFRVRFPSDRNTYLVETMTGAVLSGPFFLPRGITWNSADTGAAITFPGKYIEFLPTGNTPISGNGSPGRIKIINGSGYRIDLVVTTGGVIRQTPTYASSSPPF